MTDALVIVLAVGCLPAGVDALAGGDVLHYGLAAAAEWYPADPWHAVDWLSIGAEARTRWLCHRGAVRLPDKAHVPVGHWA